MTEHDPPLPDQAGEPDERPSLVEELKQLAADGRILLEAEFAYQKSRAAVAGHAAKSVAIWVVLALLLLLLSLGCLAVGLLIALTPLIGPWAATAVVAGGFLVAAGLSFWLASLRWKRASRVLANDEAV